MAQFWQGRAWLCGPGLYCLIAWYSRRAGNYGCSD